MPEETELRAAELVWRAWCAGELLTDLPLCVRPVDPRGGMAVQTELEELAGPGYGWKIAATSPAGQAHIAVDGPLPGRLFNRFLHADGDTVPSAHLHMAVVEAEFAFRMAVDLDPAARYDMRDVLAAVETMHLAIEVPESRFRRFERAGAAQLLADDGCAGRFVFGRAVPGWAELDLAAQPVTLRVNDVEAATGSGANVLSDPRVALCWIANELPRLGRELRAGDVVTTGTTTVPARIGPGDRVVADFGELGVVSVRFAR